MLWDTLERCLLEPFLRFNLPRYGGVMPPVPVGDSELTRERPSDAMMQTLVNVGKVTGNEARTFAGFDPRPDCEPLLAPQQPTPAAGGADAVRPFSQTPPTPQPPPVQTVANRRFRSRR